MKSDLYKFGWFADGPQPQGLGDVRFEYPNIWSKEKTSGPDRLVIAPSANYIKLLQTLVECLRPPFLLLYVLVVPRGGSSPGRYESNYALSGLQIQHFFSCYSNFLEYDARHNMWIRSKEEEGMLVYDRHNVIYAYGPLERFTEALVLEGLTESKEIRIPDPHAHRYHEEFDLAEQAILNNEEWTLSPLRAGDENSE